MPFGFVIVGFCIYCFLYRALLLLLSWFYDCEILSNSDYFWIIDDEKHPGYTVACFFFEQFDFHDMKRTLLDRIENVHRCTSRRTRILGLDFFKQMSKDEWRRKRDKVVVMQTGVHTDADLN